MKGLIQMYKGVAQMIESQQSLPEKLRNIQQAFIDQVIINPKFSNAEKLIEVLNPKTLCFVRDYYHQLSKLTHEEAP